MREGVVVAGGSSGCGREWVRACDLFGGSACACVRGGGWGRWVRVCWCCAGSSEGCLQALSRAENLKEEVDEELGIAVICREIFLQQVHVLGA